MEKYGIVELPIEQLEPHPDNPRKNLGDLTELIESIRQNGIMQNLTVLTLNEDWTKFRVLIGHRRLAAAKAHLDKVPCRIVADMDRREQISMMLQENMQRNDLTPYEEGQSFQLMLDLGETESSIAEKTGFSRTKVHHRVEMAKLDPKILQSRMKDRGDQGFYQLTLSDLIRLEKIEDVKERNDILDKARDSSSLASYVSQTVARQERDKRMGPLISRLEDLGAKPEPKELKKESLYSSNLNLFAYIDVGAHINEEIQEKNFAAVKQACDTLKDPVYYRPPESWGSDIRVYTVDTRSQKKRQKEEEARKAREKEEKAIRAEIRDRMKAAAEDRAEYIRNIMTGFIEDIEPEDVLEACRQLWNIMTSESIWISEGDEAAVYFGVDRFRLTSEQREEVSGMPIHHRLILAACSQFKDAAYILTSTNAPHTERRTRLKIFYEWLDAWYGYQVDDEVLQALLDGTSELYPEGSRVKE